MGRGEMTPEGVVEGAMATIEAGADGADLVVLLDEYCAAFVTTDLIQRGTPGMLPSRVCRPRGDPRRLRSLGEWLVEEVSPPLRPETRLNCLRTGVRIG